MGEETEKSSKKKEGRKRSCRAERTRGRIGRSGLGMGIKKERRKMGNFRAQKTKLSKKHRVVVLEQREGKQHNDSNSEEVT